MSSATAPPRRCLRRVLGVSRLELGLALSIVGGLTAGVLNRIPEWHAQGRHIALTVLDTELNLAESVFTSQCGLVANRQCDRVLIAGRYIEGAHGHPAASREGIAQLASVPRGFAITSTQVDGTPALVFSLEVPEAPPCQITYIQAPQAGAAPSIHRSTQSCP